MIYDLIIIGAGPAGAVTALYAARLGLTTLLLDKCQFPRDKICGDAIWGKAVTILRDLQLEDAVANLPGTRIRKVVFGNTKHVEAEMDLDRPQKRDLSIGYVIRRSIFDAFLFDRARAAAATCLEGFDVQDLVWEDGRVCGVVGCNKSSGLVRQFRGRVVVGADGYRSIVARKVGSYTMDPAHWLVAIRCYQRDVAELSDRIELHYLSDVTPGYFWIFPADEGLANIGIAMLASAMKRRRVHLVEALQATMHDSYFAPRFAYAAPIEKAIGWHLPVGSTHRACCGPGYLLVGDAAGLIDPFTGEGIANAMYSGRVAATAAAGAIKSGDVGGASICRYDRELWDGLGDELRISTQLQRIAGCEPLLNFTIRKAARSQEVKNTVCAMIAGEVSRKQMTSLLFYLKLIVK